MSDATEETKTNEPEGSADAPPTTGTYALRASAIRAARSMLEKEGVAAPLADVHFKIVEHKSTVEGEADSFSWERIDLKEGTVGSKVPDGAAEETKEKAREKAAEDAIKAEEAKNKTPTPPVADAKPPLPIASDNPAKDAEMPACRKGIKLTDLKPAPEGRIFARRPGTKQALLIDLMARPEGATFGEIWDACTATGKPWTGSSIRSGIAWDVNHVAGYGITSVALDGLAFAKEGRVYEAHRLGVIYKDEATGAELPVGKAGPAYDAEVKQLVYRLSYPKGMTEPLAHKDPEPKAPPAPKTAKEPKAAPEAVKTE